MKNKSNQLIRASVAAFVSLLGYSQATLIQFDLSPAGSSAAVGLRPENEAPPVNVPSAGSGNEISAGITFDTETNKLSLALGYGAAAGFTNLTGPAISMHIHGPAAVGNPGPVLFDLAPIHFAAPPATGGGIIYGSVVFNDAQEIALLNNLNYINIHTAANSNGEIRGQLVRGNVAPDLICAAQEINVECGADFTSGAVVSDFDGDSVELVWRLNGSVVKTQNIAAGTASTAQTAVNVTTQVHSKLNLLTITAKDSEGDETVCMVVVNGTDTKAPVINSLTAKPSFLWPPNNRFVSVKVDAKVTDSCDLNPSWKIISVTSNQGNKSDWNITADNKISLRAERNGKNNARVYNIRVQATDESGNLSAVKIVKVRVPHNR